MMRKHALRLPPGWNTRAEDWTEVDRRLGLPTLSEIKALAYRRIARKEIEDPHGERVPDAWDRSRQRPPIEAREPYVRRWIGLYGERQVARELDVRMHLDVRRGGDKRVNLTSLHGVPIDVITRRVPQSWHSNICPDLLLHEQDAIRPELAVVLVIFCGTEYDAYVVGWQWEHEIRRVAKWVDHQGHRSLEYPPEKLQNIMGLIDADPYVAPAEQLVLV